MPAAGPDPSQRRSAPDEAPRRPEGSGMSESAAWFSTADRPVAVVGERRSLSFPEPLRSGSASYNFQESYSRKGRHIVHLQPRPRCRRHISSPWQ